MASKWLPGYTYDVSSGRYRRADTSRFVKRDTITDLLETSISQRARDIRKGFEAVLNQELGTTPWLHRTAQELKREHLELAALAAGGWDRLMPTDYARIEGRLNFDFKHLANMAREISEGTVSLAQGLNRLDMYLGSARREYLDVEKNGRLARVKDGYALIAKRHLAPHAIHCTSCEEYALWPWRPADVVPVPTEACLCGNACRCDIEYKETPLVYMEMAEFNPHHDALGRFATGPGMHAPDTGGGGGVSPRGSLDTAEGLQRSISSGVKAAKLLDDTHAFKTYFQDYKDGTRAVVKPEMHTGAGDQDPAHEVAAYEMDVLYGLGMVPATITSVAPDGKTASVQRFIKDAEVANKAKIRPDAADFVKMQVFDLLIGNGDRHGGNYMLKPGGKVVLIDHGLAFEKDLLYVSPKNISRAVYKVMAREAADEVEGARRSADPGRKQYGREISSFISRVNGASKKDIEGALSKAGLKPAEIEQVKAMREAFLQHYYERQNEFIRGAPTPRDSKYYGKALSTWGMTT